MSHMVKFTGSYHAYRILQFTFILAPIIAGLDKFFYYLTDWSQYISPFAMQMLGKNSPIFMMVVGVVEVLAGIGVIFRPRIFSYIIFLWLLAIFFNLLLTGKYFDIALRDLGLALSALALGNLSYEFARKRKIRK